MLSRETDGGGEPFLAVGSRLVRGKHGGGGVVIRRGHRSGRRGRQIPCGPEEHESAGSDHRRQERTQDKRDRADVITPPRKLRCQKFFGMTLCLSFSLTYHCTTKRLVNMTLPTRPKIVQKLMPPLRCLRRLSKKAASMNIAKLIGRVPSRRKQKGTSILRRKKFASQRPGWRYRCRV